ncbi:thiol-disulfide isomerase/thioredoxin [Nocardioides aurantiacus]|uniref:Thiol-disulfide isomerase/thioredoxin n=1 Tax=Nocardioides aurantiacus TaxID=86796 RepID=A0A3N2CU44_9ACTN|nr:thiol-disulfide isomerase/thioredoxin [Nocardioides aurantiacus]
MSACTGSPSTGDKGYVDADDGITRLDAAARPQAGDVSGETLEGQPLSLDDYRGRVVVINVWGSWCADCRAEAPLLQDAARDLAGDDVAFVGINTRDSGQAQALAFQRRYDVSYPSLFDPSGRTLLAFRGRVNPAAIPSTVILDEQGKVAATIIGEVRGRRTLAGLIEDVRS